MYDAANTRETAIKATDVPAGMQGMFSSSAAESTPAYPFFEKLGFRLMSLLRVALALSGLLVTPQWRSLLTALLLAYVLYGAIAHGLVLYRERLLQLRVWHWLDVAWGVAVVTASGGSESVYYLFFIYPIVVASLRRGTREGVAVSVAAVAGWLALTLAVGSGDVHAGESREILLRAAVLLLIGYVAALWAGVEAMQKKGMHLLGELNRLPNPRFGPDRLIAETLEHLRDFYQAENCVAIIASEDAPRVHWAKTTGSALLPAAAEPSFGAKLLALPERCVVIAHGMRGLGMFAPRLHIKGATGAEADAAKACGADLTRTLGARSWISVPLEMRGLALGRLYVLSRHHHFGAFDIWLLRKAMEKVMPLVDAVRLLDELATGAANKERGKIGIDLHDRAIQPYLGLKLGLEALRRKVHPTNALATDIDDLCRMTQDSIDELRGYVRDLRGHRRSPRPATALLDGLRHQVDRFRNFYGLEVEMNLPPDMKLNDRLAAELVQMIGESLSNIGRHTGSRHVTINLSTSNDRLVTHIINHGVANDESWQDFTPVSLTKRAQYLGGSVEVKRQAFGGTAVQVTIPL